MSKRVIGPFIFTGEAIRDMSGESVIGLKIKRGEILQRGWHNPRFISKRDKEIATLFAAAPELLEALKKVYAFGHARPEPWIVSLIDEIRCAISKAEGKTK